MLSSELDLLLRTSRGNVPQIVRYHIFTQHELTGDDHQFLERHREQLEQPDLVDWLCRRPPNPAAIVRSLLRKTSLEDFAKRWLLGCGSLAACLDPDVFDDLVEQMRSCEDVFIWWSWAQHLRTGCDLYRRLLGGSSESPALAHALFPFRRDEKRLVSALRELVRTGKAPDGSELPTSPWLDSASDEPEDAPAVAAASESLRCRAKITAFLERQNLLSHLDPRDTLPESVRFSVESEVLRFDTPEHFFLSLALRWPDPSARAWYVRQFLGAARRGARWDHLVEEMLGSKRMRVEARRGHTADASVASAVLEQVAIDSWSLPEPAPWLGSAVFGRLKTGSAEEWLLAFGYLDRVASMGRPDERAVLLWEDLCRSDIPVLAEVGPGHAVVGILRDAPPPPAPGDDFDAKVLSYAPLLRKVVFGGGGHFILFRRLASLPRTPERAKRMLAMALEHPDLFGEVPASVWEEVVDLAGPTAPEHLPEVEEFLHLIRTDDTKDNEVTSTGVPTAEQLHRTAERARANQRAAVRVYRRLAGPEAETSLRQWVRAPLEQGPAPRRSLGLHHVRHNLGVVPEALDEDLRATIAGRIESLGFAELASLHEGAPDWVSAARVAEVALAEVSNDSVEWTRLVDRPRSWLSRPIVMARVAFAANDHELGCLIDWLRKNGARESDLLPLLLARVKRDDRHALSAIVSELARQLGETLSSGTLWKRHGPHVIRSLLKDGAWAILLGAVQRSVQGNKPLTEIDHERYKTIVPAAHEAMAVVILGHLGEALRAADGHTSGRALRTLLALHAPSRLSGRLHGMRKLARFSVDVGELFDLNLRMMRHGTGRDATLADLESALAIWFEQGESEHTGGEQGAMNAAQ